MLNIKRTSAYADHFRRYNIVIDGKVAAQISEDETIDIPLNEGIHSIYSQIAWCRSRKMKIDYKQDENYNLLVESNLKGIRILLTPLMITLFATRYLNLIKI